ncbi:putative Oxygen regulatory protein NreC [delta proteobacterium NaphS2]|nr:putative Oxygen regulatory protein NreC [delta proteobacterium NaphS2]
MDEKGRTRILLADDHRVVIEGLRSALEREPEFQVVGEALDGHEAVEKARVLKPDIIIMDISMPRLDGIAATKKIKEISPESRIVIYTMHSDKDYVVTLFKEGVSAFVLKEDPLNELILALKAVKGCGTYFSTKAPTILVRHMETLTQSCRETEISEILSQREMEVFLLLAKGESTKAIARALFISPKTVETHRYHIMQKLEADSVVALTRLAIRNGLIQA